jgi:endoglycosylceramidase
MAERRSRWAIAFVLPLVACSMARPTGFSPVDSDGRLLRDGEGRALVLRGVNVRVAGVFDVTFDDGRAPREAIPQFDAGDVAAMRRLGFNLVRLPIDWSALEPRQGEYSSAYLDRVAAVVDLCRAGHLFVLLDLHQDGFSKELCEDGAPLWAVVPPPAVLVGGPGPLAGPLDCHASAPALAAFKSFFVDDANQLQERYVRMAQQVAMRFRDDDTVMGYELFNEPIATDEQVAAFSARVASAIRAVDPRHLVVFEPPASRNFTNAAAIPAAPLSVAGGVYAVHIYTAVFGNNPHLGDGSYPPLLSASIAGAREEADAWGTPLFITEFGIGQDAPNALAWIGHALDDADAALAATAYWLWKEESQGNWGLFDHNSDGSWTPRPAMVTALSRPYFAAIGGDPVNMRWDGTQLSLRFTGRAGVPPRHDVFWNRPGPTAMCDGQLVRATVADGALLSIDGCGGGGEHTLTLQ